MQVQTNGKTYRVDFKHGVTAHDAPPTPADFRRQHHLTKVRSADTRFTQCTIGEVDGEPLVTGIARCHQNDQFSRETGRKRSLAKALKHLFPIPKRMEAGPNASLVAVFVQHDMEMARAAIKETRRAFWLQYQGRFPDFSPRHLCIEDTTSRLLDMMPSKQREVYYAINRERAYQDRKYGGTDHDKTHSLAYWMDVAEKHLMAARSLPLQPDACSELIQVAATITACLEIHGVVEGHETAVEVEHA